MLRLISLLSIAFLLITYQVSAQGKTKKINYKKEGYVKAVKLIDSQKGNPAGKFLEVVLVYASANEPKIREVARVSKSGKRVYANAKRLPIFKRGQGLVVMTTPKGIMTAKAAKKEHVGGEVLFKMF